MAFVTYDDFDFGLMLDSRKANVIVSTQDFRVERAVAEPPLLDDNDHPSRHRDPEKELLLRILD